MPTFPGAWHVDRIDERALADGRIWPQSAASQLVGLVVGARERERTLDLCAAPGGKATMLAGEVVAVEVNEGRARELAVTVERLGARNIRVVVADGRELPPELTGFDRALVDAPCSGLGVLNRRPDLRWRSHAAARAAARAAAVRRGARARPVARSSTRSARSTPTSRRRSSMHRASRSSRRSEANGRGSGIRAAPSSCRRCRTCTAQRASSSRASPCAEDPPRLLDVRLQPAVVLVPCPGEVVGDAPASCPLAIEPEVARGHRATARPPSCCAGARSPRALARRRAVSDR